MFLVFVVVFVLVMQSGRNRDWDCGCGCDGIFSRWEGGVGVDGSVLVAASVSTSGQMKAQGRREAQGGMGVKSKPTHVVNRFARPGHGGISLGWLVAPRPSVGAAGGRWQGPPRSVPTRVHALPRDAPMRAYIGNSPFPEPHPLFFPRRSEMSLKENAVALPSEPTARATTPVNMPAAGGRTTPVAAYALGGDDTMVPPPTPGLPMSPMHPARPMRSHDDHGHQEELARAAAAARQAAEAEAVAAALQAETDDDGGGGGWKINNLFSPVLSFLGGANEEEAGMAAGVEGELDADREAAAAAMMAARNLASDSALTDDTAVGDEAEESGYATADEEEKQEQNGAAPYDHDVQMEDAHDQAADAAAADLAAAHLASPIAFRRRPEEEVEEAQQQTNSGYEVAYDATDASYSTLARPSEGEDSHNYSAEESHHADVEEDEEEEFNPYLFIKSLPRYNLVVPYPHHKICLPPKDPSDPPISLVLDLDETLVHCTVEPISDADMVFPVVFNGVEYSVNVRKRPYLEEFLQKVAGKFEVSATR